MGHQTDARKALRDYAHDLHSSAPGAGLSAGGSKQDDASIQLTGSGAPHQLAIAAVVVCVVLLGGIGLAAVAPSTDQSADQFPVEVTAQPQNAAAILAMGDGTATTNAIRAFNDLGMDRARDALMDSILNGTDSLPSVQQALATLLAVVDQKLSQDGQVDESDPDVVLAINVVESAVRRPPGLDPEGVTPGTADPGSHEIFFWIAPGRDPNFVPPGRDPLWTPPGLVDNPHNELANPGAPGQNQEEGAPNGGKP
ncbi:MAG: hypothetical protein ABFR95_09000 [Actinomycetota bacterium]